MSRPPLLGTVNGFVASRARFGRKGFVFDGTTKGLAVAAQSHGAGAGSIIEADYGGGFGRYRLVETPHDMRAGGLWPERIR